MTDLQHEIFSILRLFACLFELGFFAGLIIVPVVLIAREQWKRGRRG